jgi:hypothetical protein
MSLLPGVRGAVAVGDVYAMGGAAAMCGVDGVDGVDGAAVDGVGGVGGPGDFRRPSGGVPVKIYLAAQPDLTV